MAELLPAICENGEAYAGLNITNQSKVVRDIHCKCQELFLILILRGVPLGTLFRVRDCTRCKDVIHQQHK